MRLSRSLSALALLFIVGLAGCGGDSSQPEWTAENTPLVEREIFFGNPEKAGAQISPDGSKISYLAPVDGVLNVWVGPADDPAAAQPITNDTERGVRIHFWAYTSKHVLYLQDKAGDENWRVYAVDLDSGDVVDLTPFDKVQARIEQVSHLYPEEILIALNDRNPRAHDIHRVNITTGERTLVQQNDEGFAGYLTDDDYQVRFAQAFTPEGGANLLQRTEGGWEPFLEIPADDAMTTSPAGFDKSGKVLYMVESLGRDTAALVAYDLESGEKSVIGSDPKADLDDVMVQPTERTVQAVAFNYERKEWTILDESIQADLDYLKTVADGDIEVTDRTLDDKHWIVVYLMDDGPVRYYLYDREAKQATFLFTNRPALEGLPLAKMHPVVIPARDGLGLVSYYSLPVWSDADGDGKPSEPQPLMLWVHGGPWARDAWGYDPYHQWFTNRGYAVLGVNFRGSTGFGKAYVNAGNMEWGKKMHDDLIDAVDWAVAQGIADPDKVCIGGGSYGGYATLAGLTMTPDKFACGVDIVGPSNLITLFNSIPPYWAPMLNVFTNRVGDHRTEEGRALLTERSPLTYVDQISKPLLIGQGANDPRVNQAEADQIVAAMKEKNIPVTYVLYGDEGHGFARPENRLSFNAVTEAFLAEILGGRVEPIGDDFEGSSIEIVEGSEHVRGLDEQVSAAEAE
jgi:dipeptidyl aminopeptidase/acylaminoacyl peptidase